MRKKSQFQGVMPLDSRLRGNDEIKVHVVN
jgi:hypothetical protein